LRVIAFCRFFLYTSTDFLKKGYEIVKNFKILSGLSLATVLALIPAQSLAKNSIVTQGSLTQTSGNDIYSGGFNKNTTGSGSTSSNNNRTTLSGTDGGGVDYSNRIVYGGGNGDGTKAGGVYKFEENAPVVKNELTINKEADVGIAIGGEGKGAQENTLKVSNGIVNIAVGGNATFAGNANYSGDAIKNKVVIEGDKSVVKGTKNNFGENRILIGGRAVGDKKAVGNGVEISGGTIGSAGNAKNSVVGGYGQQGEISDNYVNISGGTFNNTHVYGAQADFGGAGILKGNSVTINSAGSVLKNIIGAAGGNVSSGNKIVFKNGTADNLYGAYNAKNSTDDGVEFSGGKVKNIYGSFADIAGAQIKGSKVDMSGGSSKET